MQNHCTTKLDEITINTVRLLPAMIDTMIIDRRAMTEAVTMIAIGAVVITIAIATDTIDHAPESEEVATETAIVTGIVIVEHHAKIRVIHRHVGTTTIVVAAIITIIVEVVATHVAAVVVVVVIPIIDKIRGIIIIISVADSMKAVIMDEVEIITIIIINRMKDGVGDFKDSREMTLAIGVEVIGVAAISEVVINTITEDRFMTINEVVAVAGIGQILIISHVADSSMIMTTIRNSRVAVAAVVTYRILIIITTISINTKIDKDSAIE